MPGFDPHIGLWFLPFTLPIGIWVAWSDMKFMKIPNKSVLALLGVYLLVGPLVLPLPIWAWGWAWAAGALAIGFLCSAAGLVGAGDAKFAAAMAPFFVGSDIRLVLALFSACLLAAFASHRLMRRVSPFRAATPDWASWTHRDFPMGLALSGTLVFFPLLGLFLA
jgi:prepilin peptidase CpaA